MENDYRVAVLEEHIKKQKAMILNLVKAFETINYF